MQTPPVRLPLPPGTTAHQLMAQGMPESSAYRILRWVNARRVTLRHVSSHSPFRTVLETFTSYGSTLSDQSWS